MLIDLSDVVFLREGVGNALLELALVCIVVEQYGIGFPAVAPSTSCFLEVGLDAVRTVDVDHEAHIGFVDAHAEGISGHHHAYFVLLPPSLALILDGTVESCVVEGGRDACLREQFGIFLRASSAACIDDGRTLDTLKDMNQLFALVGCVAHHVGKVLPLETHAEDVEVCILL